MSVSRLMQMASAGKASGPSEIGEFFEGGFYTGNIIQGGIEYYLIVAPKATGESAPILFNDTGGASPVATKTLNNGPAATDAMVAAGGHPAASFCAGLTINSFSDWYLPARDELELAYRNLKPITNDNVTFDRPFSAYTYPEGNDLSSDTIGINRNSNPTGPAYTLLSPAQTSVTDFITGGAESFTASFYWSSSEFSGTNAWIQNFGIGSPGSQGSSGKGNTRYVRAFRRVAV